MTRDRSGTRRSTAPSGILGVDIEDALALSEGTEV